MSNIQEEVIQVTRITRTFSKPFDEVVAKLKSSIDQGNGSKGLGILSHLDSKESFENAVNSSVGPHSFMQFAEYNHGPWMKLYLPNAKRLLRIVFGNPLIAITMLKHDTTAGLFVPVEALIVENEDGVSTSVLQVLPSSLIASHKDASNELKEAAQALDAKLKALWDFVAA